MSKHTPPTGIPGDVANVPMLKIEYRTDAEAIQAQLPPGFSVGKDPMVYLTVYSYPVLNEPELGCTIMVAADYDGVEGQYALGYAIDQEDAIYTSREHWGQPKYLAKTQFFTLMGDVTAKVIHHGHTFIEYNGRVSSNDGPGEELEINEWWIKSVRETTMETAKFSFNPQVVKVYAKYQTDFRQSVKGELILRESQHDPIAQRLPVREMVDAYLWTPSFLEREISVIGELDPNEFWPYAETIGGTRWPANV